ncbi:MAG TPA: FAD binding domain-containing protein [Pirellulales bacterium]|nr:FAD binding domain-containing protein [Pirellulales bacterium]
MKPFEYAAPTDATGVLELLDDDAEATALLAGGTDLVPLMAKMIVTPRRVVNITEVASLRGISADSQGVSIGATTTLDELFDSPELDQFPSIRQAIDGINSDTLRAQGTIGGELLQRPQCWYFRGGHGLLAESGKRIVEGDSRYHAIFGNAGPAKFVSPSRIAPALIALGAQVRIIGPSDQEQATIPVEALFRTPRDGRQREHVIGPNQLLTHILLPARGLANATYEVRQSAGPDFPLVGAAASLRIDNGVVRDATIVLGQVAPTPWVSYAAAQAIIGQPVDFDTASAAGEAAIEAATPLADNAYKVRLASVAVRRAILRAAGLETGGIEI